MIPLVQSDAGFIQDIEDACQAGADLGGQPDSLTFTAGECRRGPVQGEVVKTYTLQKHQALLNLPENPSGNLLFLRGKIQIFKKHKGFLNGKAGDFMDGLSPHLYPKAEGL